MSQATYLQPDIVQGRATGRFRLVELETVVCGAKPVDGRSRRALLTGLIVATLGSVLLWLLIGVALF